MKSKLVLGTVQFGCNYGINSAGRPDSAMVASILDRACGAGIAKLDTSSAYGDSEQVLGRCIPEYADFEIISKYPKGRGLVKDEFAASLQRLGRSSLYGYLLHHFQLYRENRAIWEDFRALRESGRCSKVGFSLYSPDELEILLEDNVDFDIVQIPRNIFDRKFDPYFPELKRRGIEIHVRSTFLQGLFFKDRDNLPEKLLPMKKYLLQLDEVSASTGESVADLAMAFNLGNPSIDGVLIGVDNLTQLEMNLKSAEAEFRDIEINVKEQDLLNPVNWK